MKREDAHVRTSIPYKRQHFLHIAETDKCLKCKYFFFLKRMFFMGGVGDCIKYVVFYPLSVPSLDKNDIN